MGMACVVTGWEAREVTKAREVDGAKCIWGSA